MSKKVNGVSVLLETAAGNPIGGQTSASLSRTADTIEITSKSSEGGYREYVSSWKDWSVDADAFVVLGDAEQENLQAAFDSGSYVNLYIRVGDGSDIDGYHYSGQALITDLSEEYGQDDAVTFTVSFQGSGPLVRTVGAAV